MTKCGRVAADRFDYSPAWIRQSVTRSLARLHTSYLDVVFTHDVEFVTVDEAVAAVGELFALKDEGRVRYVGISGYPLPRLVEVARAVRRRHGRHVDAVQVWGQLTLQNTVLLDEGGLAELKAAGIDCVFASSPLAIGLLRKKGVPVGELGDFHPAPPALREAAAHASEYVEERDTKLAELALKYAVAQGLAAGQEMGLRLSTILGGGTTLEIEDNWEVGSTIVGRELIEEELKQELNYVFTLQNPTNTCHCAFNSDKMSGYLALGIANALRMSDSTFVQTYRTGVGYSPH
ncbi:hypothetical protein SLS58_003546 [Diplodia intermedia]|uniref:NADP-dependent oxidoreductase domain-containing protein n=1 Tax=Diplodia intermedia TaxID=856260 RepID=A0ABR3TX79_9PEZI